MGYDLILVGTGFASTFFLQKALTKPSVKRVLVLERGRRHDWEWQVRNKRHTKNDDHFARLVALSGLKGKDWAFTVGLGGSSNCWWANAMRFHPYDFDLKSRYGIADDWPIGYGDLEPYYCDAEDLMSLSGDNDSAILFPRSRPFRQPRHRFSRVARLFKNHYPDTYFAMPQARARESTSLRNTCCSNSTCHLCPVNAKFTIGHDLAALYDDPRVELRLNTEVTSILTQGDVVTGVASRKRDGQTFEDHGEVVGLGTNGIFNPFLLLKSGIDQGPVGLGLHEQLGVYVTVLLDGVEDGDGSAHITGVGYNEIHGEFRRTASGGFYETPNLTLFRPEQGKWRSWVHLTFMLEDLRDERNYVGFSSSDPERPVVHFTDWSDYAHRGRQRVLERLPDLLSHLPVEGILVNDRVSNHAHLLGTTVMGTDKTRSVIDAGLVHHRYRNLLVLGSGAFPTGSWANPTLTLSALSLRAADLFYGKRSG